MRRAIRERQALQARPWEEDLLHWAKDGTLHGRLLPPAPEARAGSLLRRRGRRLSTTSDGWCPAWAEEVTRQYLAGPEV